MRRIVEADGWRHTAAMEAPVPAGARFRMILRARAVDELTGAPPRTPLHVRMHVPERGLVPRTAAGGLIGLLGVPLDSFPALRTRDYPVRFSVRADGYIPREATVDVPADGGFPTVFTPLRLGDLALHRRPVRIAGRVTERAGGLRVPVAGAAVEATELWPRLPGPEGAVASEPPTIVALRPALHFGRGAAGGRLRRRRLVPAAGEDKALLEPASAGARRLHLSDRVGLAAGDVLGLDADPAIREHVEIAGIEPVGGAELPAGVVLTHPLAHRHRRGTRVRKVNLQPPGPTRSLRRDAIGGDAVVLVDDLAGLTAGDHVEVFGAGPPREFHRLSRFEVQTDAEGRFRMPPLSRVAQLTLEATEGARASDPVPVIPDYSRRETRVDIAL